MPPTFAMCTRCYQVEPTPVVRCPRCSHYSMIPIHAGGLTLEAARGYAQSVAGGGDRDFHLRRRWIVTFKLCMERLLAEGELDEATVALFWTRLWGIVVELPAIMQPGHALFASWTGVAVQQLAPKARAIIAFQRSSVAALDGIRGALTEDMLVYLEWRRHVECHMKQSAFMVQLNGKPDAWKSAKTRATLWTLGREVGVVECWEALERVSGTYGDDNDHAVTRAFAEAIDNPAFDLVKAWVDFDRALSNA